MPQGVITHLMWLNSLLQIRSIRIRSLCIDVHRKVSCYSAGELNVHEIFHQVAILDVASKIIQEFAWSHILVATHIDMLSTDRLIKI